MNILIKSTCSTVAMLIGMTAFAASSGDEGAPDLGYFGVYSLKTNGWDFTFTPYMFVPARVEADSTVNGGTVPLSLTMSDTLRLFSGAFAGRFEAWHAERRYGAFVDGSWMRLRADGDFPTVPFPTPIPLPQSLGVDIEEAYVDFGLGYRLNPLPLSQSNSKIALNIEPILGGRWHYMRQEIDLKPGPLLGGSRDWWEPIIGARMVVPFAERWSAAIRGDVGGFDIGSRLTYNVYGGVDYRPWKSASFKLGYRVYYVDYSDGSGSNLWGFDGLLHGPYLGVTFYF
jgi:hypothetical protein